MNTKLNLILNDKFHLGLSGRSGGAEQGRQVAANDAGAWRRAGQHGTPHGHMDQRPPTRCGLLYYYMKY